MTVRFTRSLGAWLTVMLLGTSFCPLGISASPAVSAEEAAAGDKQRQIWWILQKRH